MKLKKLIISVIALFPFLSVANVWAIALPAPAGVMIVEMQTQGLGGASEEYVVIANTTKGAYDLAGHSLRYRTASGAIGGTLVLNGSMPALSTKTFVSSSLTTLKDANPSASLFTFGLADTGGTLQLIKTGQTDPVDQVGWGSATIREGTAAVPHERGWSLVRSNNNGVFQDTNNNAADFTKLAHACLGLSINEIQPLQVSPDGYDIDQAIELASSGNPGSNQNCPLAINGTTQDIANDDIGSSAGLAVITNLLGANGQPVPLSLLFDAPNNFQFMPRSLLGGVVIPGGLTTQPMLLPGQTYARFSTGFKATYQPTLGEANQLRTTPLQLVDPAPTAPTDSCGQIQVNEVLPNPTGDDTGNEWAEFTTSADHRVSLANCVLQVNGTAYSFAADQFIAPDQYLTLDNFSDGLTTRTLSLRNSGTNTVSFGRLGAGLAFVPLQTIQYQDAPEGESWARFDDGWRWVEPTRSAVNAIVTLQPQANDPAPTEFPAPVMPTDTSDTVGSSDTSQPPTSYAALTITELLPNPAPPATDDTGEFVELYNPTDQAVALKGYQIQSGNNYTYSYTLNSGTLLAHQYAVYYSGDTNIVLANTIGQARLLDPAGHVINQTDSYDSAPEGQSWADISGTWQWTASPTPGSSNIATVPLLAAGSPVKSKAPKVVADKKTYAATHKPTADPKTTAKPNKKTSTAKNAKPASKTPDRQVYKDPAAAPPGLHPSILAGVGVITLLYAGYEYRHDAVNTVRRFQRYRGLRRAARAQASGR